ncbi:caa(3)-type oxidase, subunit IV [Denitrovibrio acetiphilus DSM 12809]|uniref:Caa(3)-type oxidase, subunit IV n=1 Tax=Denitrovibrio acetiphilus (strain DSM 12809 / NBRC 114555 / N2460) TaxID=522772 RepID=D4H6R6_DENA2|nr:cytochrome C oxidase subunit IV family protein [Denitrovibrio acetiphilus]ADD67782.1 caa(3)-type oxidase, subunit IV [Denitrovibrio acetiphilus DSM 12809]
MEHNQHHHITSLKTASAVLGVLLFLTFVTVAVSRINLGYFNVVVALALATTKSLFVILFFMHLKYENRMLKAFVFICFLILAIFIGMTFFDVGYRAV